MDPITPNQPQGGSQFVPPTPTTIPAIPPVSVVAPPAPTPAQITPASQKTSPNTLFWTILGGIVLVGIAAGAFIYYQDKQAQPAPIASESVVPQSYTYTNEQFGFQLELSPEWGGYRVFISKGSQGVGSPTYLQFALPTTDITKYASDMTGPVYGYVAPFTITVSKKANGASLQEGKISEDKDYEYFYSLYSHFNELPPDVAQLDSTVTKIISTFKFTR